MSLTRIFVELLPYQFYLFCARHPSTVSFSFRYAIVVRHAFHSRSFNLHLVQLSNNHTRTWCRTVCLRYFGQRFLWTNQQASAYNIRNQIIVNCSQIRVRLDWRFDLLLFLMTFSGLLSAILAALKSVIYHLTFIQSLGSYDISHFMWWMNFHFLCDDMERSKPSWTWMPVVGQSIKSATNAYSRVTLYLYLQFAHSSLLFRMHSSAPSSTRYKYCQSKNTCEYRIESHKFTCFEIFLFSFFILHSSVPLCVWGQMDVSFLCSRHFFFFRLRSFLVLASICGAQMPSAISVGMHTWHIHRWKRKQNGMQYKQIRTWAVHSSSLPQFGHTHNGMVQ